MPLFFSRPSGFSLTCWDQFKHWNQLEYLQVIPALLDSDEVSQEEKIRAMRELRLKDDDGIGLR